MKTGLTIQKDLFDVLVKDLILNIYYFSKYPLECIGIYHKSISKSSLGTISVIASNYS